MIYVAGDKHGFNAIKIVIDYLEKHGIKYENLGIQNQSEDIKLEDMIPSVVNMVLGNKNSQAIISCGTGIGVEVGVNKFSGIRACLATNEKVAEWARVYDNCNTLCLVGWDCDKNEVFKILDAWFRAEYDGSKDRLKMFEEFNKWH